MKRKPRVLIDSFHLLQALTGIRTYTLQLCQGLEEAEQDEVEYLIYPDWRKLDQTQFLRGKVNPFKKLLNHLLYFFWKQLCLPVLILVKRIDLVVAPDYLLPAVRFRKKGLAVVHDTFYWELQGTYNPVWRWYFLLSVRMGLNRRSGMIVTTQYIAKKARKHLSNQLPVSVVYQAPKDLHYSSDAIANLERLGIPREAHYFLHVGIFDQRKNLGALVRAYHQLIKNEYFQKHYLVLAGARGVGIFHDDFKKLNQLIEELGLKERIIMPGFVPNEYLGDLYQQAFAYVFPSKEEGFGIPVIEAMNSGTPVIVSNQPALVEVGGEAALVFDLANESSLYLQMRRLSDPVFRTELMVKGSERATEFTRNSFINQFHASVLQSLKD